jgi:hypothetical protein
MNITRRKTSIPSVSGMIAASKGAPGALGRAVEHAHWPELKLPSELHLPDFKMPSDIRLPDVAIPRMHTGQIHRYDVQLPDVAIPRMHIGDVHRHDVQLPDVTLPRLSSGAVNFQEIGRGSRRRGTGRGLGKAVRMAAFGLFALAMAKEMSQPEEARTWEGTVMGVPYDFRPPTAGRLKDAWWNKDAGLITRMPWGMGWTLNVRRAVTLGRQMLEGRVLGTTVGEIKRPSAESPDDRDKGGATAASPGATAAAAEQRSREDVVNQASIDSFPASDPPAH